MTAKAGSSHLILLVEDDDQVRGLVRALLAADGFTIIEARTGTEALSRAEEAAGSIDLLLSDMLLPERSGYDVAKEVKAANPNVKVEMEYIGFDARTEKIVAGIGAKRAPHITQLVGYEVLEYQRLGFLAQTNDMIKETGGPERWQPNSLAAVSGPDGNYYGAPYSGGGYRTLWYWKPAFDQAGLQLPQTWD